jgi:hypothetical protein
MYDIPKGWCEQVKISRLVSIIGLLIINIY